MTIQSGLFSSYRAVLKPIQELPCERHGFYKTYASKTINNRKPNKEKPEPTNTPVIELSVVVTGFTVGSLET
uniref:Uncharacterized protein n=1 Tax=Oscillatoriales cyanobacterium SpSt-402 TaxID=2282168 RepID=A0A832M136_9CYAN